MFLKNKRLALSGLLLAVSVIFIYLGSLFEGSTLFFLAAASFCTGIVYRESGFAWGIAFLVASLLLGLILSPQKLYVLTFGVFAVYILFSEAAWDVLMRKEMRRRNLVFWVLKYILFNLMYLPLVLLAPRLVLSAEFLKKIGSYFYPAVILGGQVFLYIFDWAYCHFQAGVWEQIRNRMR